MRRLTDLIKTLWKAWWHNEKYGSERGFLVFITYLIEDGVSYEAELDRYGEVRNQWLAVAAETALFEELLNQHKEGYTPDEGAPV
jgi:hypothetical protein